MKIIQSSDLKHVKLNMIIYSLTGAGKTHFVGTAQECKRTSPTLIVDVGGGMTTLADKTIDVIRPTTLEKLQEVYDFFRHENKSKKYKGKSYESVCIDGLTGIQQELSMPEVQGFNMKDPYDDFMGVTPPDRRHWLNSHAHMRLILRAFRDLCEMKPERRRVHVIMTALEKRDEQRSIICPNLPGVVGLECGAYVDILARLSVKERIVNEKEVSVRHISVVSVVNDDGDEVLGKNRNNKLGVRVWRPTVGKLMSLWYGDEAK